MSKSVKTQLDELGVEFDPDASKKELKKLLSDEKSRLKKVEDDEKQAEKDKIQADKDAEKAKQDIEDKKADAEKFEADKQKEFAKENKAYVGHKLGGKVILSVRETTIGGREYKAISLADLTETTLNKDDLDSQLDK